MLWVDVGHSGSKVDVVCVRFNDLGSRQLRGEEDEK